MESDQKPLSSISKKPLHLAPPRLQVLFDIIVYRPEIIYINRTEIFITDTLSRDCILNSNLNMPELQMEIHFLVSMTELLKKTELILALKDDKKTPVN